MKLTRLSSVLIIASALLLAAWLTLLNIPSVSLAQSGSILMTKTLNRTSNVVRVGEALTFTIAITNNSAFTLTNAGLIDMYDQTVLAFARAIPVESVYMPTTGVISWSNVAAPPIPAGTGITITVVFTVEHPKAATVNRAETRDLINDQQALSFTTQTSETQDAIGGAAPILKFISPLTATPQAGLPVTFTHIITNDGAAFMTYLPLTDTYDATFLQFNFAIPTPSITSPGQLIWTDLTAYFGNITPFTTIIVTTVFTATTQVVNTVNQASTQGARDEYSNDLTPGLAQVPIIIIDNSSGGTSGGGGSSDDDDAAPAPTPVGTATAIADAFIAPTATLVGGQGVLTGPNAPIYLPETGYRPLGNFTLILVLLSIIGLVGYLFLTKKISQNKKG